jgi:putative ABC transport system permease protein
MLLDLRYAFRSLLHSPGFALVAIVTLGLGIGANSVIFSTINAMLLSPFDFPDQERIVDIWEDERARGASHLSLSPGDYVDLRKERAIFEHLAAYRGFHYNLTGPGRPERLRGVQATADLFPTLGALPMLGRTFTRDEEVPGRASVAVISHGVWQRTYGGDSGIVGRRVMLEGESFEIIGVMRPEFNYPPGSDVWAPLPLTAEQRIARSSRYLSVIGKLRRGMSIEHAALQLEAIGRRIDAAQSGGRQGLTVGIRTIADRHTADSTVPLSVLMAAVVCVLLIACTNVANLLLTRATRRGRELAVRAALGAGRRRIVRQLLTEAVVLALLGGGLGILIAVWGLELLQSTIPRELWRNVPGFARLGVDVDVLLFTLALAGATGVVFGLAPALRASKLDLVSTLKEGGRGLGGAQRRRRFRGVLVVAQVALALALLVAAGLLIRSYDQLQAIAPGFDPHGVLTMWVSLPEATYPEEKDIIRFFDDVERRIATVTGVTHVALDAAPPYAGEVSTVTVDIAAHHVEDDARRPAVEIHTVGRDYFATIGTRILQGRGFTRGDVGDAPHVVVVSRAMAERYWPGVDPIGERLTVGSDSVESTVIGVAADTRSDDLEQQHGVSEIFLVQAQHPRRTACILVRTTFDDPHDIRDEILAQLWSVDRDQAVFEIQTLTERLQDSLRGRRITTIVLTVFAAVALLLAIVGIYSVASYAVSQRTHEIGVRIALGARRGDVMRMVLRQGLTPVLVGLAVGVPIAMALTGAMQALLYGVGPRDPITFVGVSLLLPAVALVASYIPARRAMRVEPVEALRYEG